MKTALHYGLIITYIDGSHDHFKFPHQTEETKVAGMIERLLMSSVLTLQMEDRLYVIPTANIRNAEIFPAPEQLPEGVIRNVVRVSPST
jgi:hypothetical protein